LSNTLAVYLRACDCDKKSLFVGKSIGNIPLCVNSKCTPKSTIKMSSAIRQAQVYLLCRHHDRYHMIGDKVLRSFDNNGYSLVRHI